MRVFFLFLLIINGLIGSWFYFQPVKNNLLVPSMASDINTLALLNEKDIKKHKLPLEATDTNPKTALINNESAPDDLCYTLGPFKDEAVLRQAQEQLVGKAQNINVRKREESQNHRYWVYLPALPSRSKAIEQSKQLAQVNISDYYIIHSGEEKNIISLGHFKEKKYADHRIKQLKKVGYDTEMKVIVKLLDIFWLDYSLKEAQSLKSNVLSGYLVGGVARLNRSCK